MEDSTPPLHPLLFPGESFLNQREGDQACFQESGKTWEGPERRKVPYHPLCQDILDVQERLANGDSAIHALRTTQKLMAQDTREVLEILATGRAFFKFAKWFGRATAAFITFCTPVLAAYLAWKAGRAP